MYKVLSILALSGALVFPALVTPAPAGAQAVVAPQDPRVQQGIERRLARITRVLELDANQAAMVRQILGDAVAQHRSTVAAQPRGTEARRTARRALRDQILGRIDAILNPQQRERLDAIRDFLSEHREGRRARRHGLGV